MTVSAQEGKSILAESSSIRRLDKLAADSKAGHKPWVKYMGELKHLRKETALNHFTLQWNHGHSWRNHLVSPLDC